MRNGRSESNFAEKITPFDQYLWYAIFNTIISAPIGWYWQDPSKPNGFYFHQKAVSKRNRSSTNSFWYGLSLWPPYLRTDWKSEENKKKIKGKYGLWKLQDAEIQNDVKQTRNNELIWIVSPVGISNRKYFGVY